MSAKNYPRLKVILLGDHDTGKTCYWTTLYENRFPPENGFTPGIAYSFTLSLTIPAASPFEDPSARWGSGEQAAGGVHKSVGRPESKRQVIVAPWDIVTGQDPNYRLRPLAYANADAVALCFSVVDRASFRNIRDQWYPEIVSFLPNVPTLLLGMKSDLRNSINPSIPESSSASSALSSAHVSPEEGHALAKTLRAAAYVECSSKGDMDSVHASFQMLSWLALGHYETSRVGRGGRYPKAGCIVA